MIESRPNSVIRGPRGGKIYLCDDWPSAFAMAREGRKPIVACVGSQTGKGFPSGRFEMSKHSPTEGQSYLGRCVNDAEEAAEIIIRLKAQGIPFEEILQSIRDKASAAIAKDKDVNQNTDMH